MQNIEKTIQKFYHFPHLDWYWFKYIEKINKNKVSNNEDVTQNHFLAIFLVLGALGLAGFLAALGFEALLAFWALGFDPDFLADEPLAFFVGFEGVAPFAGEAGVVVAAGASVVAAGVVAVVVAFVFGALGVLAFGALVALVLGAFGLLADLALDLLAFWD